MKHTLTEIIICEQCRGVGKDWQRTSAYDSDLVMCSCCKGSGRMRVNTTIEKVPYMEG